MADLALPLALIGGGLKIYGSMKAGAQNKAAAYAAAHEEEIAGAAKELQIREAARKAIGEQLAAQGSNGFMGGTGSALDALTESQVNMALDVQRVRRAAASKALSLRTTGNMARSQGVLDAVGALVGTGSQVAGMSADWAQVKPAAAGGY